MAANLQHLKKISNNGATPDGRLTNTDWNELVDATQAAHENIETVNGRLRTLQSAEEWDTLETAGTFVEGAIYFVPEE